ncbi:vacuolar protein sorting-associated protein 52 [Trichomonascus vanleenenianus]|uniref:Vps52p n=1 Tax=Trichomonascus vanleenenianus TaxID=2268995 RepID=UPI003ECABD85
MSRPPSRNKESTSDPVLALESILNLPKDLAPPEGAVIKLPKHRSLRQVAETAIPDHDNADYSLEGFSAQMKDFEVLHDSIVAADSQLKDLQDHLIKFDRDLESVSKEMESLQTKSIGLKQKIEIRSQVDKKLSPVVQALVIPPTIVKQIIDQEAATPQWRAALRYVIKRREEMGKMTTEGNAVEAATAQMQLIVSKAVERIRDFVVTRIKMFRKPGASGQAIQRNLLEYKELFAFLAGENSQLADDLRMAYRNTMRWYYSSYFDRYIKSLAKLPINQVQRTALLGDDSGIKKGLFSRGPSTNSTGIGSSMDYTSSISSRINIISSDDPSVMLASIAEATNTKQNMETAYRSLSIALVDNCSVEYQFLHDFMALGASDKVKDLFNSVFEPTFTHAHNYSKHLADASLYDAYGILICIRLAKRLEFEAQHRKVPVMEDYLNLELINLWPRFQSVMDSHSDSLQRAANRSTSHSSTANESVPHPITQQFASFISGVLMLCPDDEAASEPVANSVSRVTHDFESFLTKISKTFDSKGRERFLHHNYALVSAILAESTGKLAEAQREHFSALTDAYK